MWARRPKLWKQQQGMQDLVRLPIAIEAWVEDFHEDDISLTGGWAAVAEVPWESHFWSQVRCMLTKDHVVARQFWLIQTSGRHFCAILKQNVLTFSNVQLLGCIYIQMSKSRRYLLETSFFAFDCIWNCYDYEVWDINSPNNLLNFKHIIKDTRDH